MVNKVSHFMVLFVGAVLIVSIPGVCMAQTADNTEIYKRDVSTEEYTADQQGQIKADNTGINKRDMAPDEITADQQGQTKEDREISQRIRQAVVDDSSLSTYAHNVKIITIDRMVTLKGPVRSEDERRNIEEKAGQIAGRDRIISEIEIAPKNYNN